MHSAGVKVRPRQLGAGVGGYSRGRSCRGRGRGRQNHDIHGSLEAVVQPMQAPETSICTTDIHGGASELQDAQDFSDLQERGRHNDMQAQEADMASSEPSPRFPATSASHGMPVDSIRLLQPGERISIGEQELPSSHSFEPCIMETWMLPPAGIPSKHNGSVSSALEGWGASPSCHCGC